MPTHELNVSSKNTVLSSWSNLLAQPIEPHDYKKLKDLAINLYEQGRFRQIVRDLPKVNLKAILITALLQDYTFTKENHRTLELASHLMFFNKNSDILYAQDGAKHEPFPSYDQLPAVLERYAEKSTHDCFYLIYTSSAQVVYYNKLTQEARVFLCDHAGWGIHGMPDDHVFSLLLRDRTGHVDSLVDVPAIDLPERINPHNDEEINALIQHGGLFVAFYHAYQQEQVNQEQGMDNFKDKTGYYGHYLKTIGDKRTRQLDLFLDYVQESLFPMIDNHISGNQKEDRKLMMMPDLARSHEPTSERMMERHKNPRISKVIAHPGYSKTYLEINTREQLINFLMNHADTLHTVDYGEVILARLDYAYLYHILLHGEISNMEQLLTWLENSYNDTGDFPFLQATIIDICTDVKPWALQSTLLDREQYPDEASYHDAKANEKHLTLKALNNITPADGKKINVLASLPATLQDDDDVVLAIAKLNTAEIEHASLRLKKNAPLLLNILRYHYKVERCIGSQTYLPILEHADTTCMNDINFLVDVIKIIKRLPMELISPDIRDDRRSMLSILNHIWGGSYDVTFNAASKRLKACPWFVLAAIRQSVIKHGSSSLMNYAEESLHEDSAFIMQVLKVSGLELANVGEPFASDRAYVTPAVMQKGEPALRAAAQALQQDKFLRFAAIAYPTDSQAVLLGLFTLTLTTSYLTFSENYSFMLAALAGMVSAVVIGNSHYRLHTSTHNQYLAKNTQLNGYETSPKRPEDMAPAVRQDVCSRAPNGITPAPSRREDYKATPVATNQSMFRTHPGKIVAIEVVWKGPLQTPTREYTNFSVWHGELCIARFHMANKKLDSSNTLRLGVSDAVLTQGDELREITVRVDYLKCGTKNTVYVRDASGNFKQTPQYIGDGVYTFTPTSPLTQELDQTCRLVINNQSEGTHVHLEADFKPVAKATTGESLAL